MNKKLLAVAVAGVLAAPTAALAQSSVTISGLFKLSLENLNVGNYSSARASGSNNSYNRMADDSSRIIFNVVEDLGGGLQAIGQLDTRFKPDDQGSAPGVPSNSQNVGGAIASGNSHVGLRSKTWGRIFFGRQDVHYGARESELTNKATLRADSISILSYSAAGQAIGGMANATRTPNIIHYTTPNWGGFTLIAAYSTNGLGTDSDLGNNGRKGFAWNINPQFQNNQWTVGYTGWGAKADPNTTNGSFAATAAACSAPGSLPTVGVAPCLTPATTPFTQRADRVYGSFRWTGLMVGLVWDRSQWENFSATGASGVKQSKRDAWSIPAQYVWGPHNIMGHYTWALDDKATSSGSSFAACNTAGNCATKARMWAIAYAYDMSKRTSAAITYTQIRNDANAAYNFFTTTSLGDASGNIVAGEDPKIWALTLRHAF